MSDNFQIPDLTAFSLHVTVHIAEDNLPAFFKAMKPVFDRVAAEPECLYFEIFQDPAEPGKISWVENWNASPQWLFDVSDYKVGRPARADVSVLAGPTSEGILQAILCGDIANVCQGTRVPHLETSGSGIPRAEEW